MVADHMMKYLFNIYKSGIGSHYDSAGFKYGGLKNINGINPKYYIKDVAIDNFSGTRDVVPATSDIGLKYNVEFRYAGVLINPENPGQYNYVVTNPGFMGDDVKEYSNPQ